MRSTSDNGFECISFPKIWAAMSITGSGSINAVDAMSGRTKKLEEKQRYASCVKDESSG